MLIQDVFDVLSVAVPAIGSLVVGMVLSRKLAALGRQDAEVDRRVAQLVRSNETPILRRPDYRPQWRFPLRALRPASLWIVLMVLASRSHVRCTPDPQPAPAVIDCARERSALTQTACALAAAIMLRTIERLHP